MKVTFENLGTVNKNKVTIGNTTFWFSYQTCVGFNSPETGLVVRHNDWSTTTGKLLNDLQPDKDKRISGEKFEHLLDLFDVGVKKYPNTDSLK